MLELAVAVLEVVTAELVLVEQVAQVLVEVTRAQVVLRCLEPLKVMREQLVIQATQAAAVAVQMP
jgi:hypothetical protein